jgi:hypothetical protein
MDPFYLSGHGVVLPGHDKTPAQARTIAAQWLGDRGVTQFEAQSSTEAARVGQAWHAAEHGFVGEDHTDGQPVTVVHAAVSNPDRLASL